MKKQLFAAAFTMDYYYRLQVQTSGESSGNIKWQPIEKLKNI
jgi:hypothetical protein